MQITPLTAVVALVLLGGSISRAHTLVSGDNIALEAHPTLTGRYSIKMWLTPDRNDNFDWSTGLTYENMSIRGFDPTSDSVRMYLAQAGDVLSRETIGMGKFPSAIFEPAPHAVGNDDFFMGFSAGGGQAGIFGWAHLGPRNGQLTMIANRTVYGGGGIVVGTSQIVPEPSSWLLILMAAVGALFLPTARHSRLLHLNRW